MISKQCKLLITLFIGILLYNSCTKSNSETEQNKSDEYPTDSTPLEVSPGWVDVDMLIGDDFIVETEKNAYIFKAYFFEPALDKVSTELLKDCFDGSFTGYEDDFLSMKQLSERTFSFHVKPNPDYDGDSYSWSFFFYPSEIKERRLVDGSLTIVCTKK